MELGRLHSALTVFVLAFILAAVGPALGKDKKSKGHWTEWSDMSECSATCGSGTVRSSRQYIPGPDEPPREKPYMAYRTYTCTNPALQQCPRDGSWTGWGRWNECTKACGSGIRKRKRDCSGRTEGGKDCKGENFDEEKCNKEPCPRLPPHFDMSQCLTTANFTCASEKMCINLAQKCDGTVQCHDGSDEMGCPRRPTYGKVRYNLGDDATSTSKQSLWLGIVTAATLCILMTMKGWCHQ